MMEDGLGMKFTMCLCHFVPILKIFTILAFAGTGLLLSIDD
jgi:hypothetical protein